MNPAPSATISLSTATNSAQITIIGSDIHQVGGSLSLELQKITNDLFFDNIIDLGKYVPHGFQHLKDTDINLPMRSAINDIKYEMSFRKWFRLLMKVVVGGEEPESSSKFLEYWHGNVIKNGELWLPLGDLSDWDTSYYSEELLLKYYQSLPKSRKDFLCNIQPDDVLSVFSEQGVRINMREIKASSNTDHVKPFYQDIYNLYLAGKESEALPESERTANQTPIMNIFSRIDANRSLIDNLSNRILSAVQKNFLQSNSHTEINGLILSAEMSILDSQPVCSIKDEFTLSLAYLDWLFSLPPILPLNSAQGGQLSTIRASNADALFSKLFMLLSQDITFSVPPIDELNTFINPLFIWFISSGIFNGYATVTEWSSPTLATLSMLTPDDYRALHMNYSRYNSMVSRTKTKEDDDIGADTNTNTNPDENSDISIISGYYSYEMINTNMTIEHIIEFFTKNPFVKKSPYMEVIKMYPPIQDIIGRDLQTQLSAMQRSIYHLSSETMFIRLLLENIYIVGSVPSGAAEKKTSCAYTYIPYEMLTFLSPAPTPGLYWDQSIYILIRHILDYIIIRDVNKGVVYSTAYSRFMQFYEQFLKEASNSQNKSYEQLDDIFNLDIFTKKIYFKQAPRSQPLNIPANAGKYFSTLIVRGVLSRLPAHSKLLIKLLLHIAVSFMVYLRVLADYELYVTTPKPLPAEPSTTFHAMKAHLSHTPSWRMFVLVVDSLARFLASGQIKTDILNMFLITHMNYKDCLDTFELDSAFEEDTEISPEAAGDAQDLIRLILTRTIQIFYTQFMREEVHWAIQKGVPERKINKLVYILHSSHPVVFYFYNITILLHTQEPDSVGPAVSKTIPLSDLPYVVKYMQCLVPDIKFYKQVAGTDEDDPCIYAVSVAKTLIVPLPLPLDDSNKGSSRFSYHAQQSQEQSQSSSIDKGSASVSKDTESRWLVLKEIQQSWTCIYLRHKRVYTLNSTRGENLAVYLLYRVVYNMIACRAHGHVSVIEKILTSKVLPDRYLHNNPLFSSMDFAHIRRYIAESNKLADELELRVQGTYKSCSTGALDLFSQGLLPFNVNFTFKECVRSAVLRLLILRLMAMFDTDLTTLDFSPLWDSTHPKKSAPEPTDDTQREPYVFGGESIVQSVVDNSTVEIDSWGESRRMTVDGAVLDHDHCASSLLPSEENHQRKPVSLPSITDSNAMDMTIVADSVQSLHKADILSFILKNHAHCTKLYLTPQWNIYSVDTALLALHQQQGLVLKYMLFPGFYLPHELSLLLATISEITRARYTVGLDATKYTPIAISFALLTHHLAAHLSAGDLLLMLIVCTGASICNSFSNNLYIEMSLRYPIFHQILSTRVLEDILTYLPENFLERLGLSLEYVDPLTYLRRSGSNTIDDLTADQQELLEVMAQATGINPSYITLLRLIPNCADSVFNDITNMHELLPRIAIIVTKQGMPDSLEVPTPNSTDTNVISLKDASLTDLVKQISSLLACGISVRHVAIYFGLRNLEVASPGYACQQDIALIYNILQTLVICNMCC